MAYLLRFLRTRGLQRGVLGSSRAWLGVWLALSLGRQLNKRLGKDDTVVERIVLRPGDTIQVGDTGVAWADDPAAGAGRGRRARRKARRASA